MQPNRRPFFCRLILVLSTVAASVGFAADAMAETFTCTPSIVGVFANRVHVRCTVAAPGSIPYFAVCSANNSAYTSRVLSIFTTAKVTEKNLLVYYNAADTSGTACGCQASDCRLVTGAEVRP